MSRYSGMRKRAAEWWKPGLGGANEDGRRKVVKRGGGSEPVGLEGRHTILLIQASRNKATRTYLDYETVSLAMDGLCNLFEKKLRELNPVMRSLTYDVNDLYKFMDDMEDVSALVYDPKIQAYVPCTKDWIKKRCFNHLKRQAT